VLGRGLGCLDFGFFKKKKKKKKKLTAQVMMMKMRIHSVDAIGKEHEFYY
jgi:hypothetical protein